MTKLALGGLVYSLFLSYVIPGYAQSIGSGTVQGTVTDPSGAVVAGAQVNLRNPVTGYEQSVRTESNGTFRINSVPQNPYRLTVTASGFSLGTQDIDIRSSLPVTANFALKVAGASTTVEVQASGASVENDPS